MKNTLTYKFVFFYKASEFCPRNQFTPFSEYKLLEASIKTVMVVMVVVVIAIR